MRKTQLDKLIREEIRKSLKEKSNPNISFHPGGEDKPEMAPHAKKYFDALESARNKKKLKKNEIEQLAGWLKNTATDIGVDIKKIFTEEIEEPTQSSGVEKKTIFFCR